MPEETKKAAPTVRTVPEFKKGEEVMHKGERTLHTILSINEKAGLCRLSGLATNSPITAIEKHIPKA